MLPTTNTYVILEEEIAYRFPTNLAAIARRWLDVELIKEDTQMKV